MNNKVGLLGGTFNPIHKGHVELGLKILDKFEFNRILYILSSRPPHKNKSGIASTGLRWEMLKKALEPHPHLVPCDIEINRPQYSWTFETIRELKKVYPEDSFTFISGSEGFLKIKTWKNYKDLLKSLFFIVIVREPHHKQMVNILMEEERITGRVAFFSYPSEYLSISSTLIRNKIKLNQSIDNYVDKEVKQIMEVNQLYEN